MLQAMPDWNHPPVNQYHELIPLIQSILRHGVHPFDMDALSAASKV
jgi:hypothetical protein